MKVEIRDITKEEAVPYGDNADIVLAEQKAVVFTDDAGNTGKLYMKEEDVELLGEQYIAENSKMEYSEVCKEWFPSVSWNAYKNDQTRNLMRKLCNEPFARWLTCHECGASWMDGNCIRPNVTFRNGTQTETVLYDDWNGTAAYNSTFNPNFKKGE